MLVGPLDSTVKYFNKLTWPCAETKTFASKKHTSSPTLTTANKWYVNLCLFLFRKKWLQGPCVYSWSQFVGPSFLEKLRGSSFKAGVFFIPQIYKEPLSLFIVLKPDHLKNPSRILHSYEHGAPWPCLSPHSKKYCQQYKSIGLIPKYFFCHLIHVSKLPPVACWQT